MRRWILVAVAMVAGCSNSGGLAYTTVSLRVQHEDGSPAADAPSKLCTTLPLLLGSIVQQRYELEGPLRVQVTATRSAIDYEFDGTRMPTGFTVPAWNLEHEAVIERADGARFVVTVAPGCP